MKKVYLCIVCFVAIIAVIIFITFLSGENKKEYTFIGRVVEIYENSLIIEPNVGEEIRNSSDKISITVSDSWSIGEEVRITYTGEIMESYPAQIKLIKIERN